MSDIEAYEPLIYLTDEQKEDLERLAALNYSTKELAICLEIPYDLFRKEADIEGSDIHSHIRKGKLLVKANVDIETMRSAEGGNITAIQQYAKMMRDREFKQMLEDLDSQNE